MSRQAAEEQIRSDFNFEGQLVVAPGLVEGEEEFQWSMLPSGWQLPWFFTVYVQLHAGTDKGKWQTRHWNSVYLEGDRASHVQVGDGSPRSSSSSSYYYHYYYYRLS